MRTLSIARQQKLDRSCGGKRTIGIDIAKIFAES
jgi:hypothetical protein